jgi:N-acetylglucosaminyldiphosphoundecaprenol N-acetyl-beta-D-mannosaminyltransferase
MEWFYRLCIEPQRLWKRYLIGNLRFAQTILLQVADQRIHPTAAPQATR